MRAEYSCHSTIWGTLCHSLHAIDGQSSLATSEPRYKFGRDFFFFSAACSCEREKGKEEEGVEKPKPIQGDLPRNHASALDPGQPSRHGDAEHFSVRGSKGKGKERLQRMPVLPHRDPPFRLAPVRLHSGKSKEKFRAPMLSFPRIMDSTQRRGSTT